MDAVILNPEPPKESEDDRGIVLDIRIQLSTGEYVDLEMQTALHLHPRFRRIPLPEISQHFQGLGNPRPDRVFSALRAPHSRTPQASPGRDTPPILACAKVGRFFSASSDEQLEQLAMADSDINAAKLALDRLSADPVAQRIARDREVAIWNYEAGLQLAREEGEARGKAEGKAEGLRSVLVKLLTLKFRNLPDAVLKRISSAPEDRLELWAERIIPANSLDEVFSD